MFENYRYFLALCDELNVTRAAEKLFVTHQCLSRYLKKLEEECGTELFFRKPAFALTPEGERLRGTLRQVERLEKDLAEHFAERSESAAGSLSFGTTEGRFRIFVPELIDRFKAAYPRVELHVSSANSTELRKLLLDNKLDLILTGKAAFTSPLLTDQIVLNEKIYLVVSDGILRRVFGSGWQNRLSELRDGADLSLFENVPFAVNMPAYNSSQMIVRHLQRTALSLKIIHTSSHPDLHHELTTRNYAASFCLTMYIPNILRINEKSENKLHILPIKGLVEVNPITVTRIKGRALPQYAVALCDVLRDLCGSYSRYDVI